MPYPDFFQEQVGLLQYLESFSALDLGVRKIRWETPYIKWVPENSEERQLLMVDGYNYKEVFPANNSKLTKKWLQDVIIHRNMVKHLTEPLSFYRLGMNFYFEKMYILSFLNFFLMLEGVFGDGNTEKKRTIAAFMAASNLVYGIENTLKTIKQPTHQKHQDWFDNYIFTIQAINDDPIRKMINVFYDQRGLLSHYSVSSYRKRHDFEQEKYSSLAFISMSVCHFCSVKLRLDPFRRNGEQPEDSASNNL
ncbi:MAG: hypothetical protein JWR09_3718 [Mucilaginibacter sp.]|nr:hypothetical protein [Mucilaginibacter sp.]